MAQRDATTDNAPHDLDSQEPRFGAMLRRLGFVYLALGGVLARLGADKVQDTDLKPERTIQIAPGRQALGQPRGQGVQGRGVVLVL